MAVASKGIMTHTPVLPSSGVRRAHHRVVPRRRLGPMRSRDVRSATRSAAAPVLLAVITDGRRACTLRDTLNRRFAPDYRIRVATSVPLANAMLQRFRDEGIEVALVLTDFRLADAIGISFLTGIRPCHPRAKRALLTTIGDREAATPIHQAMALGQLDLVVSWPWESPEESLYPRVSEALATWWHANRPAFERVRVIGKQWDPQSHFLRDMGKRNGVPFGFYDADSATGRRLLRELGVDGRQLPVVTVDTQVLVNPSLTDIANVLGATTKVPEEVCDVAIIGAGPAGLAAAVYAASEGLRTAVFEPVALGGQAGMSSMIRNYLGFPLGISGEEITKRAHEQALHFGATVVHTHAAVALRAEGDLRVVTMSNGAEVRARTVVLATGVAYRRLESPTLDRLIGAGVFYGAATTEARALSGEDVYVVGGGNSAGQAALHLAEFARQVTLVVRGESLARTMSAYLIEQIRSTPNISVRLHTQVVDGHGASRLERLVLQDASGTRTEVPARALFVLIGARPRTEWLDGSVQREGGYIVTCRDLGQQLGGLATTWSLDRLPLPMETSMPGVFAVGDVRHQSVKRVASAVGEGSIAVFSIHQYLAEQAARR
ncbi:MAG: FAD-dependent oxidoreductase [Chloroflexota bacterium]|nr:FAD-dependent oxidoreductase [Chloroflexota bacterium]